MDRKTYTVPQDDVKYLKDCASLQRDLIQDRWERLARTMGFDLDTVEIEGLGPTFTAVPSGGGRFPVTSKRLKQAFVLLFFVFLLPSLALGSRFLFVSWLGERAEHLGIL